MGEPRGFIKYNREATHYRPVKERLSDWNEVEILPEEETLHLQGARCMDCGVPFCQSSYGCPVRNIIPEWNDLVYKGKWKDSLDALHATNNFPEFTGRLCPAPCEFACVLNSNSRPVTIRNIELGIIEQGYKEGWVVPEKSVPETDRRIAVIGSGPAGLACAQQLRRRGHQVTVFEKNARPGGLLRYGIPDFKMEKSILDRRLEQLDAEGIIFINNTSIGKDVSIESLFKNFHAVALCLGAESPRDLQVPGRNLQGIYFAMNYLVQQNQLLSGELVTATLPSAHGKKVIVIGGGDTGSDCVGTALRQGAESVLQFELRPKPPEKPALETPWPLWPHQLKSTHAHEEGGQREWSLATKGFKGMNNHVTAVVTESVNWQGNQFSAVGGSEKEWLADIVILALGFSGIDSAFIPSSTPEIQRSPQANIITDSHYMTSCPGVFTAGDARRGPSLIVWAIQEGREVAQEIHQFVTTKLR